MIFLSTKNIDEINEIKENQNISIAIILAFTVISLTTFIRPSIANLLKSIVGYIG
ncbi:MAG: hypothetical protein HN576_12620 [Bacteriovoracaceae bacterium]|nr:hypothetical protein [Bacteriovoracaceae bacterium]